jgi:DNA (cytosine-5)-methyltransferase 1
MKFIDLFAGLGGFHLALESLGHDCVFASELDENLATLYKKNFGIRPHGDIKKIAPASIPKHDILCAGSPCQPFSKAGQQQGFDHPKWGDLFQYVFKIIKYHRPQYIFLENVPNLKAHDSMKTFGELEKKLASLGYDIQSNYLSPHEFGIPQLRKRVFIVGRRKDMGGLKHFSWPATKEGSLSIRSILDSHPANARTLSKQNLECLAVWQELIKSLPANEDMPLPLWSMEFRATYSYEGVAPSHQSIHALRKSKGSHGKSLKNLSKKQILAALPAYARGEEKKFPQWKINFIKQNRAFYARNKKLIDAWLPKIMKFPPSLQKFEWNCKGERRDLWRYLIQFRASGVRIKRPNIAPTLVAMTTTQIPIIGWERRYMTPRECARLQSMQSLKYLPQFDNKAFKALGNAVNVKVVTMVARPLLSASGKA